MRRVERDEDGEIIRPKPTPDNNGNRRRSTQQTKSSSSDTSTKTLVDYDAQLMTNRGDGIMRLIGDVHFHHNGTIIQCDSALRYDDNRMDCFGKVVIKKDSAFIYGDRVNYDGNTNIADVFAPIVKMTQGNTTLYSYNLQFNSKSNIGTFTGGGVLSQKGNLMEAERGSFDAGSEYVRFLDSVSMRNDDYVVRTDSLGYDLNAERIDFLDRTYIWSKDTNFLMADHGNYFTTTNTYLFTSNAYVMTPDNEAWADTMRYITDGRRVYMFSNVQILDTANTTVSFGDWGYYDDSLGRAMLTLRPSVRSWEKQDTSYMKSDTILMLTFDYGKSKLEDVFEQDSVTQSAHNSSTPTAMDTTIVEDLIAGDSLMQDSILRDLITQDSVLVDSLPPIDSSLMGFAPRDSLPEISGDSTLVADSTLSQFLPTITPPPPSATPAAQDEVIAEEPEPLPIIDTSQSDLPLPTLDSTANSIADSTIDSTADSTALPTIAADTVIIIDWDQFPYVDRATRKPSGQLPLWEEIAIGDIVMVENPMIADSSLLSRDQFIALEKIEKEKARLDSIKKTEKERVMRAYHHVRLWSEEYQGVCDSMVSFSVDSTAVMYGEPILWSKANQITAEQIDLYTKNEQLDWADFTGEPFIAQQVVKNDTSMFNQATGKRLETYFVNNELDYALMSGNVQNIYYMDENLEVVALASITCAELTIIFEEREPTRMIWQGQGEGPIYPIEKVPEDEPRFLEGFTWQDSLRPKSAYEICQRTERPSQRAECQLYARPTFRIDIQMEKSKAFYLEHKQWTDRTDVPNLTPEYFIQRNQQLLF